MNYNISKNSSNKNRAFVIFVALIFLGSMAGAMLYSTGGENASAELPASRIVSAVPDAQKQRILFGSQENPADRYVLITLDIPKTCDPECNAIRQLMGQVVSAYDPAIYLSEVQATSDTGLAVGVRLESYLDKKELSAFNLTEIEDFICSNTVYRINECVLRTMDFGDSRENKTEIKESNETAGGETGGNTTVSNATTEQQNVSNSTGTQ